MVTCQCFFLTSLSAIILIISSIIGYVAHFPVENATILDSMTSNTNEKMEAFREKKTTAFVVGYTGEVGKALVKELATSKIFSKVYLIGRREVPYTDELYKDFNMEQIIVDYEKLDEYSDAFKGHSVGFGFLGTTQAKAGKEGILKVDHDYAVKVAELAKAGGCQHFNLMSSIGANKKSSKLLPKVKGEVEAEVAELGFDRVSIYRPALLMCDREESRPAEWLARKLLVPMDYFSPGTLTSSTVSVAKAVVNAVISPATQAVEIFESNAIQSLSKI